MTGAFAKITISLPAATLRALEQARRKVGASRSAAIAEAIDAWLSSVAPSDADRIYAEGYLRKPENVAATEAVAQAATASWDEWTES